MGAGLSLLLKSETQQFDLCSCVIEVATRLALQPFGKKGGLKHFFKQNSDRFIIFVQYKARLQSNLQIFYKKSLVRSTLNVKMLNLNVERLNY